MGSAAGVVPEKAAALVPFLRLLGYLQRRHGFNRRARVFLAEDKSLIEQAVTLVTDVAGSVITARYAWLEQALCHIAPLRNGVAFAEVFNIVWHFIFAEAKKLHPDRKRLHGVPLDVLHQIRRALSPG